MRFERCSRDRFLVISTIHLFCIQIYCMVWLQKACNFAHELYELLLLCFMEIGSHLNAFVVRKGATCLRHFQTSLYIEVMICKFVDFNFTLTTVFFLKLA